MLTVSMGVILHEVSTYFPSTELVPMIAAMQIYPSEAFCLKDLTDTSNLPWLSARHDVVLMAGRDPVERSTRWDR